MTAYQDDWSNLAVVLGDWDPNSSAEKFPAVKMKVSCLKIHPQADLGNSLANNAAALKLFWPEMQKEGEYEEDKATVRGVVDLRSPDAEPPPARPADRPLGVPGKAVRPTATELDLRLGLVAKLKGRDRSACPAARASSARHRQPCWVAAWGRQLERQRELDLSLVPPRECAVKLGPEFARRGVSNWQPQPSEVSLHQGWIHRLSAPAICYN